LARQVELLGIVGTPFDGMARTADVRRIASSRGLYNLPNVGIFLWRLPANPVTNAPAYRLNATQYLFNALGKPAVLLTKAQPEASGQVATPLNVPISIGRRNLSRHLDVYYGSELSILVYLNGKPVGIDSVQACNLSDFGGSWAQQPGNKFLIDPELGRLLAPASTISSDVIHVTYHAGFSANIGGGEYERAGSFTADLPPVV